MKLKADISFIEFLRKTARCDSEVWFQTPAGDRINLKSELSKYLFLAVLSNNECSLSDMGEVFCEEASDYAMLSDYLEIR